MTKDCKEVFTDIYARRVWGDGSGGGSVPDVARPYIDFVSEVMRGYQILHRPVNVLDIGCGDGVVANAINWHGAYYLGLDAAGHPSTYSQPRSSIRRGADVLTANLPFANIVLCKEVLQHLSNEQVQLLLDRTARYPRRLFTNTNHPSLPVNTDIETGDCRAVDLTLPPFNQPARTVFTYGHWIVQEL